MISPKWWNKALYHSFPNNSTLPNKIVTRAKNRDLYTTSFPLVYIQNYYIQFFSSIIQWYSMFLILPSTKTVQTTPFCLTKVPPGLRIQVSDPGPPWSSCIVLCWFFSKILPGIPSVSNSLDPDQARRFVSLIWVQTVCKGYQQMTLVGKEWIEFHWSMITRCHIQSTILSSGIRFKL